jgi:hypothetical protein
MHVRLLSRFVVIVLLLSAPSALADFIQVATTFGPQSALRDNGTKLDWLHLNLSTSVSYNTMQNALLPGGTFYGWRYATPSELKQLFADYDGSPTGIVRYNDALTIQFISDLGGPTTIADNFSTGFHREAIYGLTNVPYDLGHAQYGYIAIDNFYGATIDPRLQGSTVDSFANFTSGHWLVRQSSPDTVPEPASLLLVAGGALFVRRFSKRQ